MRNWATPKVAGDWGGIGIYRSGAKTETDSDVENNLWLQERKGVGGGIN